jgi:hypothetical protein
MFLAAAAVGEPLAGGKRKLQTLPGGLEEAPTVPSYGAICDDGEMKYGGEGDAPTAPKKWPNGSGPWTADEDAILLRMRKQ